MPEVSACVLRGIENALSDCPCRMKILFVCGRSGAGKTTYCKLLADYLKNCVVLHLDWYHIFTTEERMKRIEDAVASYSSDAIVAKEHPLTWFDWASFLHHLDRLRHGDAVYLPCAYNQRSGQKNLEIELLPIERGVVLCDGTLLLHPAVTVLADLTVMIDTAPSVCRDRLTVRDRHKSSAMYRRHKKRYSELYETPYFQKYQSNADILVNGSGRRFDLDDNTLKEAAFTLDKTYAKLARSVR